MKTKIIAVLIVLALVITAGMVIAQGGKRGGPGAPPPPGPGIGRPGAPGAGFAFGRLANQLNLTEDQVAQLKGIHQQFLTSTAPLREQMQAKCKEMGELWAADQPNAAAIKALAADIDVLRADIRNAGIDDMLAGLNVLTADQRAQLREIMKNRGCGLMMALCGGPGCCGAPGKGMGMGPGRGMGGRAMGPQDGTGPRGAAGTCPMMAK